MKLTLERQIPLVFAIAILVLAVIVFFAFRSVNSLGDNLRWEKHTYQVIKQLDDTFSLVVNAETSAREFIITGDEAILEPYNKAQQKIGVNLTNLKNLVSDNPAQTERLLKLETTIGEKLAILKTETDMRRTQTLDQTRANLALSRGREIMNEVRSIIGVMEDEEGQLLAQREAELEGNLQNTYRMLYLASIAGIFSLGLANFAVFREISKRSHAEENLKEANKNLELRVEERTGELSKINQDLIVASKKCEESEKKIERQRDVYAHDSQFAIGTYCGD